eukprot:835994_1
MDVNSHYQVYRQIAMEILQNMKQQIIYYQKMIIKQEQVKIKKEKDLNMKLKTQQVNLELILYQPQCLEESVMNQMDYSIHHSKLDHLIKYKYTLQEKCFKILSSKIK